MNGMDELRNIIANAPKNSFYYKADVDRYTDESGLNLNSNGHWASFGEESCSSPSQSLLQIRTIIEQAEEVDKLNKEIELLYDMATASFSSQFIDSELKRVGAK